MLNYVVKQNGEDYESESLKVMIASLNRNINKNWCGYSILMLVTHPL